MIVHLNTQPLQSGHAHRGIGMYTRMLADHLEKIPELTVVRTAALAKETMPPNPDIIHYPFFDLFYPTLPFHYRTRSVVTIHDVIPLLFPEHYPVGKRGKLAFTRQRLALKTVSGVITDSLSSKADIVEQLRVPADSIFVVPLAANPELKSASENEVERVRQKFALPKHYVLYVGDINYNKNIPQLIKSIKFIPDDVSLVCVGKNFTPHPIPEWQWIETQIALSGVESRVKFLTDILHDNTEDLSALFTGAVAYIQPSLYEGFGLPVLEAMRCKTPVITTPISSLPEVGGDHCVYAQPDAESMAQAVKVVIGWSKSKRQQLLRAAAEWEATFTWERTAQETATVYSQLCK